MGEGLNAGDQKALESLLQAKYDMHWRSIMLRHAAENGMKYPLYYPTAVMRFVLKDLLDQWDKGERTESQVRDELRIVVDRQDEDFGEIVSGKGAAS